MKLYFLLNKSYITEHNGQVLENTKQIPIETGDVLKFFPLEKNFLPFGVVIGENSEFLRRVNFSDFALLSIINPPRVLSGEFLKHKTFSGYEVTIVGKPYKINIQSSNGAFSYSVLSYPSNLTIKNTNHLILIEGELGESDFLLVFHKNSGEFYEFCGNVEITENSIIAVTNAHTLQKHGNLIEYEITEEKLIEKNKESVYLEQKPAAIPPFLSHIAFFEALKQKDYFLAETFLSEELKESLSKEHLQEFFSDFDSILQISHNGKSKIATISNQNEKTAEGKLFYLEYENSKISNITEE